MKFFILFALFMLGAMQLTSAPCTTGAFNGGPAILLIEPPEDQGEPATPFCTLPTGFAPPLIPFALALNENSPDLPVLLSDVIVFAPTGEITFFSDPFIPADITFNELQTEAAQNIVTVNGTTYVIQSDVGTELPEVPEPSTIFLVALSLACVGILRSQRRHVTRHR